MIFLAFFLLLTGCATSELIGAEKASLSSNSSAKTKRNQCRESTKLFSTDQDRFNSFWNEIKSGNNKSILKAAGLYSCSDGSMALGLTLALGDAIVSNPKAAIQGLVRISGDEGGNQDNSRVQRICESTVFDINFFEEADSQNRR